MKKGKLILIGWLIAILSIALVLTYNIVPILILLKSH